MISPVHQRITSTPIYSARPCYSKRSVNCTQWPCYIIERGSSSLLSVLGQYSQKSSCFFGYSKRHKYGSIKRVSSQQPTCCRRFERRILITNRRMRIMSVRYRMVYNCTVPGINVVASIIYRYKSKRYFVLQNEYCILLLGHLVNHDQSSL